MFVSGLRALWRIIAVRRCRLLVIGSGLLLCAAVSQAKAENALSNGIEIRRTTDGIPHVRADDWRQLGIGVGYVQAQDALCTLAEAFVTFEGRRSWFFGAEGQPARDSTFGRPKNIDLDFFFRAFADDTVLMRYRQQEPPELNQLVQGFAVGYNQFLADVRGGKVRVAGRSCLKSEWVREITADDIYRRMYAAQIAAGYAKFITEISNSQPATSAAVAAVDDIEFSGNRTLRDRLSQRIGDRPGIGSNMLAFGREATHEDGAVLLGNPHWYWGGPDRFYQMHLTIPGKLNVAGVTFLGLPMIMLGFNEHVAWSHTVSAARRFGLFDITLDAHDPTRYVVDKKTEAMTTQQISVDVRTKSGEAQQLTRTFYRTRFGPVLDLGDHNRAFAWNRTHALVIRDINAGNFRVFQNFFFWNQATSLNDFIAIQRREAAVPWANTVAIGRGDGRVWYGDVGAAPNAPDDLRAACKTQLSAYFANVDSGVPVLDGSRSACDWRTDKAAAQAGAIAANALPSLLREDYVANMNDSYWLSNIRQPLEGFPSLLGGERQPLELRGRLGHHMALELMNESASSAEVLSGRLMQRALTSRAYSAELFKDQALNQACAQPHVQLDTDALAAAGLDALAKKPAPERNVDVGKACEILRRWSNTAEVDQRGVLLWENFWARLQAISGDPFDVAFSSAAPLDTPNAFKIGNQQAARALALTVAEFNTKGWPLDDALGNHRFVKSGSLQIPMFGGCHAAGYFTIACSDDGNGQLGPNTMANSYLQVVWFGPAGVEARTLLAHGEDEAAVDGGEGIAPIARYARKDWLRFPFREQDIASDPNLTRLVLKAQ